MARPSGSETTCSSCGQTFPTSRQLNQHITRIHLVEPMLKRRQKEFVNCNICDKMCTGNRNLKDHLKREHHVSPIKKMKPATQPDDPPQPDSPDQDGEIPLLTTTPRKRFKCPVGGCDKDYKLKQHATRHIIDNHLDQTNGIKDFKCPICSKKFLKKHAFSRHMNQKHLEPQTETPKAASIAPDRNLKDTSRILEEAHQTLDAHENLIDTTDEKSWPCVVCDREYNRKQHLTRHIKQKHSIPQEEPSSALVHNPEQLQSAEAQGEPFLKRKSTEGDDDVEHKKTKL
eukprot:Platyproteum_vivax@DN7591_c3_g4_i2.p1